MPKPGTRKRPGLSVSPEEPVTSPDCSDLQQAWYDAVAETFGLSPATFRMARVLSPLGGTSRDLWDDFDSLPAESDGRYYEPELFNRFSDDYGAMVSLILPRAGDDTVAVALDRFVKAAGVYAYSRTAGEAREQVLQGPALTVSFSSGSPGRLLPATASKAAQRAAVLLPAGLRERAAGALTRLAAGHVQGMAAFEHQAKVWASPLEAIEILDGLHYPAWFCSAAVKYASRTRDHTVWPEGLKPDWEQMFGPSGSLRHRVGSLVLVDGVELSLASDADLAADDRAALQEAAEACVTPLFTLPAPAPGTNAAWRCSLAAPEGRIEIHLSSPPGNVLLFGVVLLETGMAGG